MKRVLCAQAGRFFLGCYQHALTLLKPASSLLGHYCPRNTKFATQYPCPPGTYSDALNIWDASKCQLCPPGRVCSKPGLARPDGLCMPGWFCPPGSMSSKPMFPGNHSGMIKCNNDYHCSSGGVESPRGLTWLAFPCCFLEWSALVLFLALWVRWTPCNFSASAQPLFFPSVGMAAPASGSSGQCQAGAFCPVGSFLPIPCTPGRKSISVPAQIALFHSTVFSFAMITRQSQSRAVCIWILMPLRWKALLLSPASGMYCATAELSAPSGPCDAGFYCTGGSVLPNPMDGAVGNICPRGHFCPAGSSSPSPCPRGRLDSSCCMPSFLLPALSGLLSSSESVPLFCSPLLFCTEACLYVPQGAAAVSMKS